MIGDGMRYQQDYDTIHQSDRLPSLFAILDSVLVNESERVGKNELCSLKPDPVLTEIRLGLGLIPRKPQRHHMIVDPIM